MERFGIYWKQIGTFNESAGVQSKKASENKLP